MPTAWQTYEDRALAMSDEVAHPDDLLLASSRDEARSYQG